MQIRPLTAADLDALDEVAATIASTHYLHVDRAADAGNARFAVERRPLPATRIESNPIGDELRFDLKQVATGVDEGLALVAEHDGVPIAVALARPSHADASVIELVDVRVDFDKRREGLGTAMVFQAINFARDREARAIRAEARSGNEAANALLAKLGFELAGLDTYRTTNHDLVKEQTTLLWYLPLT